MKKYRIAAVVVLYNPDAFLVHNIQSYLDGVEVVYAVDNSEQTAVKQLGALAGHPKVIYIKNPGNLGIAAALNLAAQRASDMYDFLLTMDQDSAFDDGQFNKFLECLDVNESVNVGILSPVHVHPTRPVVGHLPAVREVPFVMTSGNLLNLSVYKKVGSFRDELFIDHVDHEYCLRLRSMGFVILECGNIVLRHSLGEVKYARFFNFILFKFVSHRPVRTYYMIRNGMFVARLFRSVYPGFAKENRRLTLKEIVKILFEDKKLTRLKMVWLAFKHYKASTMGKLEE